MKTTIRNLGMTAITIMLLNMNSASATTAPGIAESKTVLTFIGKINTFPVFELSNDNAEEFQVTISDVDHHILLNETVKSSTASRKYRLDVDAEELRNIRFVLTNRKTKETKVYQFINNSYVVSEVYVTKL